MEIYLDLAEVSPEMNSTGVVISKIRSSGAPRVPFVVLKAKPMQTIDEIVSTSATCSAMEAPVLNPTRIM